MEPCGRFSFGEGSLHLNGPVAVVSTRRVDTDAHTRTKSTQGRRSLARWPSRCDVLRRDSYAVRLRRRRAAVDRYAPPPPAGGGREGARGGVAARPGAPGARGRRRPRRAAPALGAWA